MHTVVEAEIEIAKRAQPAVLPPGLRYSVPYFSSAHFETQLLLDGTLCLRWAPRQLAMDSHGDSPTLSA